MIDRKRRFSQGHPVTFVGPSEWVADVCRRSVVGKGLLVSAIPNIINPTFSFEPELLTEHRACVFLFGCDGGTRNVYKGFDEIRQAIRMLPNEIKDKIELYVFGQSHGASEIDGVKIVYKGYVSDPEKLKRIYHEADVFLFPSKQETQGMTKIEAMLCGLPVIAFDRTACAESIVDGETGWIVRDRAIDLFAKSMTRATRLWYEHECPFSNRAQLAGRAKRLFAQQAIVSAIRGHYQETIKRWLLAKADI